MNPVKPTVKKSVKKQKIADQRLSLAGAINDLSERVDTNTASLARSLASEVGILRSEINHNAALFNCVCREVKAAKAQTVEVASQASLQAAQTAGQLTLFADTWRREGAGIHKELAAQAESIASLSQSVTLCLAKLSELLARQLK